MPEELRAADVLVLPEAWRAHDGSSFLDGLAPLGFTHLHECRFATLQISGPRRTITDPGEGWWELAVASKLPFVEVRELPLVRTRGDAVPRRHAVSVTVDLGDGALVDVTAMHVSSKLWWAAPLFQLRSLRRELVAAQRDGSERPAVVAGDSNFWRTLVRFLLPGWRSCVSGATFPAWRPHSQIDQILARGPWTVLDSAVLAYGNNSDHRAVVARLGIDTRE